MQKPQYVLTLSCANRPGIVAAVTTCLFENGANIREAHQFDDIETGNFFSRIAFDLVEIKGAEDLEEKFTPIAKSFNMKLKITDQRILRRVLVMTSKSDHCLLDILHRWRIGELSMNVTGIISNHSHENYQGLDFFDIPFHYFPISKDTKMEQEAKVWQLIKETRTELVILARYMQVLSDGFAAKLAGKCINIHHSFLPSFKGAKPYHQAQSSGVKLIGATAHYVTSELDEGQIIDQDVERVTHADSASDLIRKGRDIERRVLARALRYHLEDRVAINGKKTVVFS